MKKGNAFDSRLGDTNLDLNTMEGYISSKVYGCKMGDSVFKRITPLASILAWAEICENSQGANPSFFRKKKNYTHLGKGKKLLSHSMGEIEESSEISPVSTTFDSRDIELRNLETKLEKSLERIKELENQLAYKYEGIGSPREELEVFQVNSEIKKHDYGLVQRDEAIISLGSPLGQRDETIRIFETAILEKNMELGTLQDRIKAQLAEIERYNSELTDNERERSNLTEELKKKMEDISALEGRLSAKEKDLEKLEESISIKDKDLQVLAEKFITMDGEIRKVEEKLAGREKR